MALTPEEIDGLRDLIMSIYGPIAEELLRDLCRCIAAAGGVTSGAEYKLLLAKSLAGADNVIADTLRRQTDLTDEAVEQLMQWAAEKTVPLENSESLRNIADAYVKVTRNEVISVLGELAAADVDGRVYPIKDVYRRTMDYVFRQVSSGAKTPEQAVRRATLRLWQRGIRTIDRSDGRSFSVEYKAQRAIMSKMGEMTTAINEKHHNDGGYVGWEISAHSACAPDHESIQGRQYSDEEYKILNSRLQRRIGTLSCKHIAWPIKLGVDKPQWTQEQLAELAQQNAQGITYEGRHYTQYEATQEQKALENSIRQCKDRIASTQEQGELGSGELRSSRILLRQLKAEYERFSAAAGLPTAPERLQAAGLSRALKADGTLEMPQPAGSLKREDGTLDIDTARRRHLEYLDTLTDAPDHVKMYLDYYNKVNPTEYRLDTSLEHAFAYSLTDDVIIYNPNAQGFDRIDFDEVALHETAHRADLLGIRSCDNVKFREAIESAMRAVPNQLEALRLAAEKSDSRAFHDILDALSEELLETKYFHGKEYWMADKRNRALEIFAELFTLETQNRQELKIVKAAWPELWNAYQSLF